MDVASLVILNYALAMRREEYRKRRPPAEPEPYDARPVDVFAGPGSVADKLRKHRQEIERMDQPDLNPPSIEPIPAEERPEGSGKFTMAEIKKGYRCLGKY